MPPSTAAGVLFLKSRLFLLHHQKRYLPMPLRYSFLLAFSVFALLFLAACGNRKGASNGPGFVDIFDGKTLAGWEGDSTYWRVENGLLVGEVTPVTLLQRNSFLIWRGGTTRDFELKVIYRVSPNGNSGINYRSEEIKGVRYALRGYQADLDGAQLYTGSNYEEGGRTTLAPRGSRVALPPVSGSGAAGDLSPYIKNNAWTKAERVASLGDPDTLVARIKQEDWNEYHLVVRGNRLQHYVNGVLMSEVVDGDSANRKLEGLLGVQVHVGPPMKVEYRSIRLKAHKIKHP
jgi:hypothetical protein